MPVHPHDEGCELYALHESSDRVVMIEKWATPAALQAHGKGPAVVELTRRLADKLNRGLDVQVLQPHPASTEQHGTL
jgi:quinol monooxygenase YgiN